jgi:hypothetical protein
MFWNSTSAILYYTSAFYLEQKKYPPNPGGSVSLNVISLFTHFEMHSLMNSKRIFLSLNKF